MDRLEALASLRLSARLDVQHDEDGEPCFIGVCRDFGGPPFCNHENPSECDNCFRFWSDDPRTDEEILKAIDRKDA